MASVKGKGPTLFRSLGRFIAARADEEDHKALLLELGDPQGPDEPSALVLRARAEGLREAKDKINSMQDIFQKFFCQDGGEG